MKTRNKKDWGSSALIDAVETLTSLADLNLANLRVADFDALQEGASDLAEQDHMPSSHIAANLLQNQSPDETIDLIKNTFRIILNHLQKSYDTAGAIPDPQTIESIKTIMVLAGEAAKKVDRYTKLFHQSHAHSVTELKEYKKLQEFYLNKIVKKIDEGMLGKWVLALANKTESDKNKTLAAKNHNQSKHIFVDLDSVTKDTEYELFFLRKDDGSRFFNPRLIRNVKLVSDFGNYFKEAKPNESLMEMAIWQDRVAHACAKNIFGSIRTQIDKFYRINAKYKNDELVENVNNALIALMLCCNSHNLMHHVPIKSCHHYFCDFQYFLRQSLRLIEYHKLITYPPKKSNLLANCLLDTIHSLCMAVYTQLSGLQSLTPFVHALLQQAKDEHTHKHSQTTTKPHELWSSLTDDYTALTNMLKHYSHGPLNKLLATLEEGEIRDYDPLMLGNIPSQLFTLYTQEKQICFARWPSPTKQEFLSDVSIVDEFKGFLRGCAHTHRFNKCLVFNFQDRTSWKEHSRCLAIEDLPDHESFSKHIDVVTLTKDTEFYHQLTPYFDDNHADTFLKHFHEHLMDDSCGNVFPKAMQKELGGAFITGIMKGIHEVFFSNKNVLLREHRLDFIEIFYLFLQLKIIELSKAPIVGYTCKDSLDTSQAASLQLFVFLKLINQERLSEGDREQLDSMIYAPGLFLRERAMLPERFNRLVSFVKTIESARDHQGLKNFAKLIQDVFGKFYKMPILHGKVIVPY